VPSTSGGTSRERVERFIGGANIPAAWGDEECTAVSCCAGEEGAFAETVDPIKYNARATPRNVNLFPLGLGSGFEMDTWEPLRPDIPTRGPASAPDKGFRSVASPDIDSRIETCWEVKTGLVVVVT